MSLVEISIFTPTYNRAKCLERCYRSLLKQTNRNFVWLIIDDGSTDDTKEFINKIAKNIYQSIQHVHYRWLQSGNISNRFDGAAGQ